jgi:hypothetical protein
MKTKILGLLLLPLLLMTQGCLTTSTGTSASYFFDPKIPGGVLGGGVTISPIVNLAADISVTGQITLTWDIDPIYLPLSYNVRIFRNPEPGSGLFNSSLTFPDPSDMYSTASAYLIADIPQAQCPVEPLAQTTNGPYVHNSSNIAGYCNTYVDTNFIYGGSQYQYWAYLYLNSTYSTSASIDVTPSAAGTTLTLPAATAFWDAKTWSYGGSPYSTTNGTTTKYVNYASMEPRETTCALEISSPTCGQITGCAWNSTTNVCSNETAIGHMKGKTAFGLDGGIMYVADTDNNRVLVYTRGEALECETYKAADTACAVHTDQTSCGDDTSCVWETNSSCGSSLYQACMFSAEGYPFEPLNILGQPNQTTYAPCNTSCVGHTAQTACTADTSCTWSATANSCSPTFTADKCLTKPAYVSVTGNQLIISDSGNNRLVVWNHLPGDPSYLGGTTAGGCDPNTITTETFIPDCTPDSQIGKKSLTDMATYNVATDGEQSFNNPTGTFVNGSDLYVADTGNNRVVKITNFMNTQTFSCSPGNWGSALCSFSGVLGQASFYVNKSFQDFYNTDIANQLTCATQSFPASTGSGGTKTSCQAESVGCTWTAGQIANQGTCTVTNPLRSASGIGNTIGTAYSYVLARYFASPTVVKVVNGRMLVSANENFSTVSTINSPILLNARILEWSNNPLDGTSPTCSAASFGVGGCDASIVFGQQNFTTLISIQGTTGKYTDVSYGLQSLDDFDVSGKSMIGVDSINNYVYLWNDWTTNATAGNPPTGIVTPPILGSVYNGQALPVIKGLGAVTLIPATYLIDVTDASGFYVYEVKGY